MAAPAMLSGTSTNSPGAGTTPSHEVSFGASVGVSTAEAARPTVKRYYRPELDLLRFFAFLLVFTHHNLPSDATVTGFHLSYAIEESGAAGVCLFFTLSAFLITELLLREREATGTIHVGAFYVRRMLRIWPLYLLFVGAAAVLPFVFHHLHHAGAYIVPYLLLCGNWANVAHGAYPRSVLLGPMWSISIEEQFYLMWPALILLWGQRGLVRAAFFILPLAWAVDFFVPAMHVPIEPQLWCNALSQFQFFALGGLLALLVHRYRWQLPPVGRIAAFVAGYFSLLIAAVPLHYLHHPLYPARPGHVLAGYLCVDCGCLLLFCAFLGAPMPRAASPFIYLGKISYGLYLFHFSLHEIVELTVRRELHLSGPVRFALIYMLSAALTILAAWLSYRFFEEPFLRLKKHFTFVPSRPA